MGDSMNRRDLLRTAAAGAVCILTPELPSQPAADVEPQRAEPFFAGAVYCGPSLEQPGYWDNFRTDPSGIRWYRWVVLGGIDDLLNTDI